MVQQFTDMEAEAEADVDECVFSWPIQYNTMKKISFSVSSSMNSIVYSVFTPRRLYINSYSIRL